MCVYKTHNQNPQPTLYKKTEQYSSAFGRFWECQKWHILVITQALVRCLIYTHSCLCYNLYIYNVHPQTLCVCVCVCTCVYTCTIWLPISVISLSCKLKETKANQWNVQYNLLLLFIIIYRMVGKFGGGKRWQIWQIIRDSSN